MQAGRTPSVRLIAAVRVTLIWDDRIGTTEPDFDLESRKT